MTTPPHLSRTSRVDEPDWWRSAVIYQIYPRSFSDGNGDGIGDLTGVRDRLTYLTELGVDALWFNPWYPSPMADGGYDVADYRDIHPDFGTLADAKDLISHAHALGLRIIIDLVPNHTSYQHPWFQQALTSRRASPERDRYIFRPGRGPDGVLPPNNWKSAFGEPAWTRTAHSDGTPGEWYLHLFAPEQPDLNWNNPEVRREFESIIRFWYDLGVDGIRIDVAHSLTKHPDLPDLTAQQLERPGSGEPGHPHWDLDSVHDIYRSWRTIADTYEPPRAFVAEAWTATPEQLARYVRPDELHTAFNFHYLQAPWNATALRDAINASLTALQTVGAPATWVLSNHDVVRHLTRYARATGPGQAATDLELGTRRARAAILLTLALPGSAYLYQGEELGLWEAEDLPDHLLQDPIWRRSGHTDRGRDGCRVPCPGKESTRHSGSPIAATHPGCHSRRHGRHTPSRPRRTTPPPSSTSTAEPSPSDAATRPSETAH